MPTMKQYINGEWTTLQFTASNGGSSEGTSEALPLAGGTMSGNINMNSNRIIGLPTTPSSSNEAASKAYVDAIAASGGGTGSGGITQAFISSTDGVAPDASLYAGFFWIDLSGDTGGLKYYNGSSWVHVPVAYT